MHTNIPFFQTRPYNVMRDAVAILRHKRADWRHRLFTFRDMQRAALLQAWDKRRSIQWSEAHRFRNYGHLIGLDRSALLNRLVDLKQERHELAYYSRQPRDRHQAVSAEIDVIETEVLPYV